MRQGTYWTGYGLILFLAALGLREMWQVRYDANLLAIRQQVGEAVAQVQNLVDAASRHVNMLRVSAQSLLAPIDPSHNTVSPLFHHIVKSPAGGAYCTGANSHTDVAEQVSISGLGDLPQARSSAARELHMALLMTPQFVATAQNIPNLAGAYYTSAQRFLATYPFVPCSDFRYSDDLLRQEVFALGTPGQNPQRAQFWTSVYSDESGKGLMATTGAPVYSGDRFAGTVAIDIALQTLSDYVRNLDAGPGTAFIVNDRAQILAHPTLIKPADYKAHMLSEAFEPENIDPLKILNDIPSGAFAHYGDRVIYADSITGAPWRFVFMTDRSNLAWQATKATRLEILGFVLLILLIAALERARLTGIKLRAKNAALVHAQEDLQHARERAEMAEATAHNANRAKSIMLANASHDLRTPLNAIIGFSELILVKTFGPLAAKYEEYIRDIHVSGNLLLAIVNDVLDLSKVEAGRYDMVEEAIDVRDLLTTSQHLVSTQAERSFVALDIQAEPDLPPLRADRRVMQQIMLNLLSNAIKFTPRGGRVEVRANRARGGGLRILVEDTGKGISQHDLQVLFTPFSRGGSADTAKTQGTGLGLTIVKAMIELHGGTVEIASEPGRGTRVLLTLPASRLGDGSHPIAA